MSYQTTYPSSPDYVIEAEYTEAPKKQKSLFQSCFQYWFAPISPSPERTIQQIQIDRYHAFVTAAALRHTTALSAMEQKAIDLAPQGAPRYHDIVDSYAEAAVRRVQGWR